MLSGAKMLQALYKNDKLHQALSGNCQPQSRLNRRRTVFAINLADEGRAFQTHAAATRKARSPSVERRVDGTISVDVEADRGDLLLKCRNNVCRNNSLPVGIAPVGIGTASRSTHLLRRRPGRRRH